MQAEDTTITTTDSSEEISNQQIQALAGALDRLVQWHELMFALKEERKYQRRRKRQAPGCSESEAA